MSLMGSIKLRGIVDFLINYKDKILAFFGITFLILGFISIPPTWGFSRIEPLVFSPAAAICLILAFLFHFRISKNSDIYEKIFAIAVVLSILFFLLALILYMFVEYRIELIPTSIRVNRIQAIEGLRANLTVIHTYASLSAVFLVVSIFLIAYSIYIKAKYL